MFKQGPRYFAVRPSMLGPGAIRVARAFMPTQAVSICFGRRPVPPAVNVGQWLVKDLGQHVSIVQRGRERQRIALLLAPDGWFDPYAQNGKG